MEENRKWEFRRERSALLVIDMQNDFVLPGGVMQVGEAWNQLPRIRRLIDICYELDIPVIYTMQETDPLFCRLEVATFPQLQFEGMRKGTHGYRIVDELAPRQNDIVITKRRFSAFYQTELELILRNIKDSSPPVDTLIICGTVSNICCESTARDAFCRDYKVVFGSDICSAHTLQAHLATIENMRFFGRSLDCNTIIASLLRGFG